jgi:ribosomal protein S18 acetylase RimI-like enzyme
MIATAARETGHGTPLVDGAAPDPRDGIRLAVAGDIPELAGVLARAFAGDPYFRYLTSGAAHPVERMHEGWTGILRYGSARLAATYKTDDRSGVAMWLPPRHPARSGIESLRLLLAMARLRGWRRLRAVSDIVREIDDRRRHHEPGPHYYLQALAVDVGRQGRGTGTALMRATLERCDAAGLPACLETVNPRNLPLYRRLGFQVVDTLTLGGTGIECWILRRPPASRA